MTMNWEAIKERGRVVYAGAAQLLVFLQLVFYLAACVVAGKPIGPKEYVSFAYHCVEWAPGRTEPTPVADLKEP
jgi:hypothetical protein